MIYYLIFFGRVTRVRSYKKPNKKTYQGANPLILLSTLLVINNSCDIFFSSLVVTFSAKIRKVNGASTSRLNGNSIGLDPVDWIQRIGSRGLDPEDWIQCICKQGKFCL